MATGVKEKEAGTMPEDKGVKIPESDDKTPTDQSNVSPEQEQETPIYTQRQADALVHAAKSDAGRSLKEVEKERDGLKAQINAKESDLAEVQDERESLEKRIEELSSDDPKKLDLMKLERELRKQERELKSKIRTAEEKETSLTEREKKVSSFELEVTIETVSDEYDDGDSAKLKKALSVFESPTEEQVRNIAEVIFSKKKESDEPKSKAPKPYSGKTAGGTPYFTRTQIADRKFWEENKEAIKEAMAEPGHPRIKDE